MQSEGTEVAFKSFELNRAALVVKALVPYGKGVAAPGQFKLQGQLQWFFFPATGQKEDKAQKGTREAEEARSHGHGSKKNP